MKKIILQITLALVSVLSTFSLNAQALDKTFGTNGIKLLSYSNEYDIIQDIIEEPNGDLMLLGNVNFWNGKDSTFIGLVKMDVNGVVDNTFGQNGIQYYKSGRYADGSRIVFDNTGTRFYIVGYSQPLGGDSRLLVMKINLDGTLDNQFDSDGKFITDVGLYFTSGKDAVTDSQGNLYIVTDTRSASPSSQFNVVKLGSTGVLNTSFDNDGKMLFDINSGKSSSVYDINLTGDYNHIIVAGESSNTTPDMAFAKLTLNGAFDNTFDSDGLLSTDINSNLDRAFDSYIDLSGNIYYIGSSYNTGTSKSYFTFTKMNANGQLDNTFDSDGILLVEGPGTGHLSVSKIVLNSNGTIYGLGAQKINGVDQIIVVKIDSDGTLDNSFGTNGLYTFNFRPNANDFATAMHLYGNSLFVTGWSDAVTSNVSSDMAIAKIDLSAITSFNSSEKTEGLIIYPNPTNGKFSIQSKEEIVSVSLTNMEGVKEIYEGREVNTIMKGLVFVEVNYGNKRKIGRLLLL